MLNKIKKYKKYIYLFIVIICSLIYSNSCIKAKPKEVKYEESLEESSVQEESSKGNLSEESSQIEDEEEKIYVYICGQIKNAGVYELSSKSRLADLVSLAGGFSENANTTYNNLAMHLEDEQKIYIPSIDEKVASPIEETTVNNVASSERLNLNKATEQELMKLRGIGESKAKQIIEYRNKNGGFRSIEDIMKIKGIKKSAFNKIKDNIYVE